MALSRNGFMKEEAKFRSQTGQRRVLMAMPLLESIRDYLRGIHETGGARKPCRDRVEEATRAMDVARSVACLRR